MIFDALQNHLFDIWSIWISRFFSYDIFLFLRFRFVKYGKLRYEKFIWKWLQPDPNTKQLWYICHTTCVNFSTAAAEVQTVHIVGRISDQSGMITVQ